MTYAKYTPCILVSLIGAAVACLYIPEITYFRNVNEFPFDHSALFWAMFPYFLAVFVALISIQLLAGIFLPSTSVSIFNKNWHVSAAQIIVLTILFGILLEGMFLSRKLPELTGNIGAFNSTKRVLISLLGWIILFILSVLQWRKLATRLPTIAAVILIMFTAMLADAYKTSDTKIKIERDNTDVLENLAFHPQDNVILILADALPTFAVEKILETYPEIREKLDGFTLFANNLGPGSKTVWAIPAILSGKTFDGGSYEDFCSRVFIDKTSLPLRFQEQGFNIFMTSLLHRFSTVQAPTLTVSPTEVASTKNDGPAVTLTAPLYLQFGFRFIPYSLKRFFELPLYYAEGFWNPGEDNPDQPLKISPFYKMVFPRLDVASDRPTMHFHHYRGTHFPFLVGGKGIALPKQMSRSEEGLLSVTEYVLRNFVAFLDELRKRGMYENATITLFGDHGDHSSFRKFKQLTSYNAPLLLVKPPKATGSLNTVNTPSSTVSLPEMADRLHQGDSLESIIADFPKERRFLNTDDLFVYRLNGSDIATATTTRLDIENIEIPTLLEPGKLYVFGRRKKNTKDPQAITSHLVRMNPLHKYGLQYGATVRNISGEIGLMVASKKKQVSLTMELLRWKTLVDIKVRDLNTGKTLVDKIQWDTRKRKTYSLTIPNLTVNDKGEVRFAIDPLVHRLGFTIRNVIVSED